MSDTTTLDETSDEERRQRPQVRRALERELEQMSA
jgi:hypothetical protein